MIQSRCFSIFPRFPTISYLYLDGTCIALAWDPQLVTVFTKKIQTRKPVEPISCACMACCSDRWRGKLGNHGFQHSNRFKYKLLTTHAFENTALKCGVLVSSEIDPCFFVHQSRPTPRSGERLQAHEIVLGGGCVPTKQNGPQKPCLDLELIWSQRPFY